MESANRNVLHRREGLKFIDLDELCTELETASDIEKCQFREFDDCYIAMGWNTRLIQQMQVTLQNVERTEDVLFNVAAESGDLKKQACAIYSNWWPMLSALMYVLVPMPCMFFGGGTTEYLLSHDGGGGQGWLRNAALYGSGKNLIGFRALAGWGQGWLRNAALYGSGKNLIGFRALAGRMVRTTLKKIVYSCWKPSSVEEDCENGGIVDGLWWYKDYRKHVNGEFLVAVIEANSVIEDQCQAEFGSLSADGCGVEERLLESMMVMLALKRRGLSVIGYSTML
ncbi:vacuolar protein sorting 55 (VPS55) family protein [Artemisia annua]|uniref:Vacuolar protein sorting 55 (VPS55) family protein n=1 Tax=Artemisia annua TaxID=35608 RepID=A0A2U1LD48_ARTAN|nr:vacuolar protein sorting 55 (VPS55) family protein [Artemisia annua]